VTVNDEVGGIFQGAIPVFLWRG